MRVVAETAHRLRFALDPGYTRFVEPLRLDHGKGNVAVQLLVVRQVHPLASALAEEAFDGIAAAGKRSRERRRRLGRGGAARGGSSGSYGRATAVTEAGRRAQLGAATRTRRHERGAAGVAEARPISILVTTAGTFHAQNSFLARGTRKE